MKTAGDSVAVSHEGVGVPPRQEVCFKDGTSVWLDRITRNGSADLFKRTLGAPAAGVVIDLRLLVNDLATDLPIAATRDVPGLVHYSLRQHFKSAGDLVQAAIATGARA